VQCPIKKCVLAVNNRSLQRSFYDVMPRPGLCRAFTVCY
jgi:hypothetical protein